MERVQEMYLDISRSACTDFGADEPNFLTFITNSSWYGSDLEISSQQGAVAGCRRVGFSSDRSLGDGEGQLEIYTPTNSAADVVLCRIGIGNSRSARITSIADDLLT